MGMSFSSYLSKTQMSMQENKWETKALQCIIVTEATLRIYHDGEDRKVQEITKTLSGWVVKM